MPGRPRPNEPGVARDASSITEIVAAFAAHGFPDEFGARAAGVIHCPVCRRDSDASRFSLEALRRLEGASDPDEQAVACALRCPVCSAGGTLVLTYGPGATAVDEAILEALPAQPAPTSPDPAS